MNQSLCARWTWDVSHHMEQSRISNLLIDDNLKVSKWEQNNADEVAVFWGYDSYNSELLQANNDQVGSVTTEILLEKEADSFTLSSGWAFPRRVYFNGENCEMPPPDTFPILPNGSSGLKSLSLQILLLLTTVLSLRLLLD